MTLSTSSPTMKSSNSSPITLLQTGTISMLSTLYHQPSTRSSWLRRLLIPFTLTWIPSIPIHTFLIHHPTGPILFDTGISPACMHRGYFPWWMPTFRWFMSCAVTPAEGVGAQLAAAGVKGENGLGLQAVVLSHLHHDHAGGLIDVAECKRIMVTKEHYDDFASSPIKATVEGALPQHWPANFTPTFLSPVGPAIGPWPHSYPITDDGTVLAVDTPGHVAGHVSVIVRAQEKMYLLLGDASYDLGLLEREETGGIDADPAVAVETLKRVKEFCRGGGVVVLPSHDWSVEEVLREGRVYVPGEGKKRV